MSSDFQTLTRRVEPSENGVRADRFIAQCAGDVSRACVQQWIEQNRVRCNGEILSKQSRVLKIGDVIEIDRPLQTSALPPKLQAETFSFPILFEDENMLIIDKPAGVVVHPAPGHFDGGTIVNALLSYVPGIGDACEDENDSENESGEGQNPLRPGIVHRLDKDTSGCLLIAKTRAAHTALSQMFAAHALEKSYLALCVDHFQSDSGTIDAPIGRHPVNRKKMAVVTRNGKSARTHYRVLFRGRTEDSIPYAFCRVDLETGRTHQIRVHMAHLQCPILGDAVYGPRYARLAPRQMLHACRLAFSHFLTQQQICAVAPVPPDMQIFIPAEQQELIRCAFV